MLKISGLFFLLLMSAFQANASHVLGGEITWKCFNSDYIFTLTIYRNCNDTDASGVSETIRVWNHPTLTTITLPFVSRTDISPSCTAVTGGPSALTCGTGANGGNGIGAIEKITYRSASLSISGTPPPQGWVFTFEGASRGAAITNLSNPTNYGLTIASKMYAVPSGNSTCVDASPIFLQDPYFISCAGSAYSYNLGITDPDMDSTAVSFGVPYSKMTAGSYNPPNNPIAIPFNTSFSYTSPTPTASMNAANVDAQLNSASGAFSFQSSTTGQFVVKVVAKSYRNKQLIAEVEREMQVIVTQCSTGNTAPVIAAPFAGGLFETTVNAGVAVNFNLTSVDNETLQDGSPQHNLLNASGKQFGTGFSSTTTGCGIAPCATLTTPPVVIGTQGATTAFNWQTSCNHLLDATGNEADAIPYYFVFKVQDDFCPLPSTSFATVTVKVKNPGVIQAPKISCIQTDASGNVSLQWQPVANPAGTFIEYQIHSVQNGLLATIANSAIGSWTDLAVTQKKDYFIVVHSGCAGKAFRTSDTVSTIFLALTNPSDGTAVLQWNAPSVPASSGMGAYYHIYREYPAGTWSLIDSVTYGTGFYRDTIQVCSAFFKYQIRLPNQPCLFTSNQPGDNFKDMLTPDMPIISATSIDTLTGKVTVSWNQNAQEDTYGYVIYTYNSSSFLYELDTVWGIANTSYSYFPNTSTGALTYSVAAFDSCYTPSVPPTYQTSAKAGVHRTVFLKYKLSICDNTLALNWTKYRGWESVENYELWGQLEGGTWQVLGTTKDTLLTIPVIGLKKYCFFIKAISGKGVSSFSNKVCLTIIAPTQPDFHYLKVATVSGKKIQLTHLIDINSGVKAISFERQNKSGVFEEIARVNATSQVLTLTDTDVDVFKKSYVYRAHIVDSCGKLGVVSNIARSILLTVQENNIERKNYLAWNSYEAFNGSIIGYGIYRGIDGVFGTSPIATVGAFDQTFTDDMSTYDFTGKVCYYVEALEGTNLYDDPQISQSNVACVAFEPVIYIPNAFMPEGVNKMFVPVLSLFNPNEYVFTIQDRWGQLVFQTASPAEGWDGKIASSGKMAEVGTYIYTVKLLDGNNIEHVVRGHVSLLR